MRDNDFLKNTLDSFFLSGTPLHIVSEIVIVEDGS